MCDLRMELLTPPNGRHQAAVRGKCNFAHHAHPRLLWMPPFSRIRQLLPLGWTSSTAKMPRESTVCVPPASIDMISAMVSDDETGSDDLDTIPSKPTKKPAKADTPEEEEEEDGSSDNDT